MKQPKAIDMIIEMHLNVKIVDADHCHPSCPFYRVSDWWCDVFRKHLKVKRDENGDHIERYNECKDATADCQNH
jgi:hypothetical protein